MSGNEIWNLFIPQAEFRNLPAALCPMPYALCLSSFIGQIGTDAAEHDSRDIVGFVHPKN